jgi:two-component system sensor histidine kinase DegS
VAGAQIRGDEPLGGEVLALQEIRVRAVGAGERARGRDAAHRGVGVADSGPGLSRRSIQAEGRVRRRVADAIHDGPVQELIGLDMILSAAGSAARSGQARESIEHIEEARELATKNIRALRDEIVDLGPFAFEELTFDPAIRDLHPGLEAPLRVRGDGRDRARRASGRAGRGLFRITQEAVLNAGRHAEADTVSISLRSVGQEVELRVADNGHGFARLGPFAASEPGHLGLASMRERAELLDGSIDIETSEQGTRVLVRAPLPARAG